MKRVNVALLCLLLAGLCACAQAEPDGSTTESISPETTQAATTHLLSSQRIASPNPFFDGMETERRVEGTSWHCGDDAVPMLLITEKIRDEDDGPVYQINLVIEAMPDEIEMHLGDFLIQKDKILRVFTEI